MLEPLQKKRLYEEIVEQLLELIKTGVLKPGDRLPTERKLAEDLHVSRTALREALRSMESMGYIRSKVGGGTFINSISLENIMDPMSAVLSQNTKLIVELLEVRRLLETETASLAAKNITPEKIAMIEKVLDDMQTEIAEGGNGLKGDNAFHNALAKASDNSALGIILGMCGELLSQTREATLNIPGQPAASLEDHREIFEAIRRGDSAAAAQRMVDHLNKAHRNLENAGK